MTRERFESMVAEARALLGRSGAQSLTLSGLDLGLDGPVMTLKIAGDSPVLDCMVYGVWGRNLWHDVVDLLDQIMPGRRGYSVDETVSVRYCDDMGLTAKVWFYW